MRHRRVLCLTLLLLQTIFLLPPLIAQQESALPQRVTTKNKWPGPIAAHTAVAGFWRTDHTFASELHLKNNLEVSSIEVSPVLRMGDGTQFPLHPIVLEPSGVAVVDINHELAALPAELQAHRSEYGIVDVRYSWHWEGAITAEVQSVDANRSLSYTSSLYPEAQATIKPQVIEGLWWRLNEKTGAFLRVTNTTVSPQKVNLAVLGARPTSSSKSKHVSLAPGETRMLDLSDLMRQISGGSGGLRLTFTAPLGGIVADGGMEDAAEGFSATLNLTPTREPRRPKPETMVRMASVGVMLGKPDPSDQFPQQIRFHPYTYLRNVSTAKRMISVGANYMYGTNARSVHLADLVLEPGSSSKVDVEAALTALKLHPAIGYINLTYTFQGRPTDLLIASGSLDGAGTYVFEVGAAFTATSMAKSICYWNSGNGMDTMLTIWNHGLRDEDLVLTFNHAQGSYKYPIHLKAQASEMLSMRDLIARSKPDADGNTLPPNVEEGSALLSGVKDEIEPMDATISVSGFDVNHATCFQRCYNCTGYLINFTFSSLPFDIQPNQSVQVHSFATISGGAQYDFTSRSDWSSSQTGVATIGTGSSSPGLVNAVSGGTTTITAYSSAMYPLAGQYCSTTNPCGSDNMDFIGGEGGGTVGVPSALLVTADSTATLNCSSYSSIRTITYSILDQTGRPMSSVVSIRENVPTTVSSCNNTLVSNGAQCLLNTAYQPGGLSNFDDALSAGCPAANVTTPCGFTFQNQQWQWCQPNGTQSVMGTIGKDTVNNDLITVDGNSIGLTGVTFHP
jgi:hypothetical protein